MAIKFGEIDAGQIVENEFRIRVLEKILEEAIKANPTASNIDFNAIRRQVIEDLKKKYPNSGLELKGA